MKRFLALLAVVLVPSLASAQNDDDQGQYQQGQYQPPPQQYQPPPQQYQPPPQQYGGPPQQYDDSGYGAPMGQPMQYGYYGPHPEPYDYGQTVCPIEGPHFHQYPPFDHYLFREANGFFYFIGDLGDFGFAGQMWGYQGNHPIPVEYGGGFCYIDWPHRHPFPPPSSLLFNFVGGYYAYSGPWDPAYWLHRAAWVGYFGGYYRSNYFGGRYWSVRPRPIYAGSYGWGARGVYRVGTTINAPGGHRLVVGRPAYAGGSYVKQVYTRPAAVYGGARPSYVTPRGSAGYNAGYAARPVESRPVSYGGGAAPRPVESRPVSYGGGGGFARPVESRPSYGGGAPVREAPRMEAPRMEAPRMESRPAAPAPRFEGGGGHRR